MEGISRSTSELAMIRIFFCSNFSHICAQNCIFCLKKTFGSLDLQKCFVSQGSKNSLRHQTSQILQVATVHNDFFTILENIRNVFGGPKS